jgi:hypothetical protein
MSGTISPRRNRKKKYQENAEERNEYGCFFVPVHINSPLLIGNFVARLSGVAVVNLHSLKSVGEAAEPYAI